MLIPWLLAIAAAAWFGLSAHRAGKNSIAWGLGGAVFGLLTATFVFGLGQAMSIPFSDHQRRLNRVEWTLIATVLIVVLGWVLTAGLRTRGLRLWRKKPVNNVPPVPVTPGLAKAEPVRPPAKRAP